MWEPYCQVNGLGGGASQLIGWGSQARYKPIHILATVVVTGGSCSLKAKWKGKVFGKLVGTSRKMAAVSRIPN